MKLAQGVLWAALLAGAVSAQGESDDLEVLVDADYRVYDIVFLKANSKKGVECTVLSEPGADPVTIQRQGRSGSVSVELSQIEKIIPRQTPTSAYRERAKRIKPAGRGDLHRRLAEWCLLQSLQQQAEEQLALAANAESAPQEGNRHRERLVGLLEGRAWLQVPTDPQLLEQILLLAEAAEQSGASSPRLLLARARVALDLGLAASALESLESCCSALSTLAAGAAAEPDAYTTELDPEAPRERFRDRSGVPFVPPLQGTDEDEDEDGDPELPPAPADSSTLTGLTPADQTLFRVAHTLCGEQLLRAHRVDESAALFQRVLVAWPTDPRASAGMSRALAAQGDTERALSLLEAALGAHPEDAELLLVRGQVRYLQGDAKGAVSSLEAAVAAAGDAGTLAFRAAQTALGLSHLLAGSLTEADSALTAADSEPGFAPARLGRGLVAEFRGDPDAARTHFEEAARLDPDNAEAHYALAQLQLKAEQFDAAENSLRAALHAGYVLELGVSSLVEVAHARGDAKHAAQLLELLYRVADTPTPRLLSALGNAYLGHKRVDDAEVLFRQALALDSGHVPSLRGLAFCAYAQEQLAEAGELFTRLLADDRVDPWASEGLAALERQAGRRVWSDGFSGTSLQTLWKRDANYGLDVSSRDGHVQFGGSQRNDAQGITSLMRRVNDEVVVQVEATFTLPPGAYRAGVRFESDRGGAVVFRDFDGVIRYALGGTSKQGWGTPVEIGTWPAGGAHRLAIDLHAPDKGGVRFVLDGKALGEAEVPALRVTSKRRATTANTRVGVYGRGQALGQTVEFSCGKVDVFVEREPAKGPTPPKRY